MSIRKVERNREIYKTYNEPDNKKSIYDLALVYGVRPPRISKIIREEARREKGGEYDD